jgi:diguanylate cyclase (GGDEF)-like protein
VTPQQSSGSLHGAAELSAKDLLLSLLAPLLAAVLRLFAPPELGRVVDFVWLLAFVPVVLLTRSIGWRGTLIGVTWSALVVVLTELVAGGSAGLDWLRVGQIVVVIATIGLAAGIEREWWLKTVGKAVRREAASREGRMTMQDLPPREVLEYFLTKVFAGARRDPPLSIVLFEIDRFAEYEDMYGRETGDHAIAIVIEALKHHTRSMNVFGQYDDRTFLVLLQGEGLLGSHAFARRILEETASYPAPWKGRIHLSAGISGYEAGMAQPHTMITHARKAVDTARRMGGNCSVVYQGSIVEELEISGMLILQPDGNVREIHRAV